MTRLFSLVKFPAFKTVYYCLLILSLMGIGTLAHAQWEDANNGLYGGLMRSAAVNADGSIIVAGVPNVGVYKSTDGGATWSAINTGLTNKQIYALAFNGTTIFAGMNGGTLGEARVFKSTNNGLSWAPSGLASLAGVISFTVKGSALYAGTFSGVYKSTDNGANWTLLDNGLPSDVSIHSMTSTATFLFAGTAGQGVYRSSDDGASWVPINTNLPNFTYAYALVHDGTALYAGTIDSGIFKSTDNGLTWTQINSGLILSPSIYVYSLVVQGTNIVAGTSNGVFILPANGTTWTASNSGLLNSFTNSIRVAGSDLFAFTEGNAVYKSTNSGLSWTASKIGIKHADINFIVPAGADLFAGTKGAGLFKSSDNAQSWTEVNTGLTSANSNALLYAAGKHFLATQEGVYVSLDEGLSWVITDLSGISVSSLILKGTEIFAASTTGVYKSSDNGVNWSSVSTGLTNLNVRALAANATQIFAGTAGGVFVSTNNGTSWSAFNTGLSGFGLDILSLLTKGTDLFAGTQSGGVFKSSSTTAGWTNANFPNGYIRSIIEVNGTIFVPAANVLWSSADNGATWTQPDFISPIANFNTVTSVGDKLFVATNLVGVLVRPLNDYFPPQLSSFAPTTGGIGTTVTITGTSLSGVTEVSFGGTPATSFTVVSPTTIEAVVGNGTSGSVSVTAPSGNASLAGFTFIPAPVISSFSPQSAGAGVSVTINGSNFTGATAVSFGGTPATSFQVLDAITISAVVGAGQSGNVSVTTPGGTATRTGFTFIGPPTITSFNPTSAPIGSSVTITGTNFSTTAANNVVKFNGTTATISGTPTTTSIVAIVPTGATLGKITVEVAGNTATSATDFIVSAPTAPTLTGFNPTSAPVGTTVTLTGTNFSTTAANNIVKFNGTTATITGTPTSTSFVTSVPTGATTGKITVQVGSETATSASDFVVSLPTAPTFTGMNPTSGLVGTSVTLTGTNFSTTAANNIVKFNGTLASITGTPTATTIVTSVPVGATTGKVTIEINGETVTSANDFTVVVPTIAGFNPVSGNIGSSVTITGTNFSTTAANNIVKFNGVTASISGTPTTTSIVTTVPVGATTGTITVEVGGATATSATNFTVTTVSSPTISGFNPASGIIGTSVTITGTNFSSTAANNLVRFNGTTATITGTPTATSIVTSVPSGATTGKITVQVGGETATSANDFIINTSTTPTIASLNPSSGAVGTSVTINGTNFSTTAANNLVKFNGVTATVTGTPTATSLVATVPSGLVSGKVSVTVNGETATSASNFLVAVIDNGLTLPYSSFGNTIQNYRIVAVPLTLTSGTPASVLEELGAANKSNWRLQRYSGGTTRDHTGSLTPGEGYWLIVRENPGVEIKTGPGTLAVAPFESGFSITLAPGWNQIGNPYNFTVNWSQVVTANPGLNTTLRKYNGTWDNGTNLAPMEGGFINNTSTASQTIIIPLTSGGSTREKEIIRNSLDQNNWQVALTVEQGAVKNRISGFGMHQQASLEADVYDGINMPTFFDQSLEVRHAKEWNGETFSTDIVPASSNYVWEFQVETSYPEEYITLRWDNTYFGENDRALVLWDVARQLPVDMRLKNSYTFSKSGSKNFKVLYGSAVEIQSELLASDLIFHSLSPNPAAESVTLHFSIPIPGDVQLEAIDMMGRVVWSTERYLEAGYHEQKWERGTERAGVYLIQIKTKDTSLQKRVVFEK